MILMIAVMRRPFRCVILPDLRTPSPVDHALVLPGTIKMILLRARIFFPMVATVGGLPPSITRTLRWTAPLHTSLRSHLLVITLQMYETLLRLAPFARTVTVIISKIAIRPDTPSRTVTSLGKDLARSQTITTTSTTLLITPVVTHTTTTENILNPRNIIHLETSPEDISDPLLLLRNPLSRLLPPSSLHRLDRIPAPLTSVFAHIFCSSIFLSFSH